MKYWSIAVPSSDKRPCFWGERIVANSCMKLSQGQTQDKAFLTSIPYYGGTCEKGHCLLHWKETTSCNASALSWMPIYISSTSIWSSSSADKDTRESGLYVIEMTQCRTEEICTSIWKLILKEIGLSIQMQSGGHWPIARSCITADFVVLHASCPQNLWCTTIHLSSRIISRQRRLPWNEQPTKFCSFFYLQLDYSWLCACKLACHLFCLFLLHFEQACECARICCDDHHLTHLLLDRHWLLHCPALTRHALKFAHCFYNF